MSVTSLPFEVFNFYSNNFVIIEPQENLVYAEDLVFHLASSLNITTVCVHLFSLYSAGNDLWLCPNQRLDSLNDELGLDEKTRFQLRIRFVPSDLVKKLQAIDSKAFEYYFLQIRYDFLHIPKKKFSESEYQDVLGMALEDIMLAIMEDKNKMENIKQQSEYLIKNYRKFCPQNMVVPWWLATKPKMKEKFKKNFKPSELDVDYIKFSYMSQFLRNVYYFYNTASANNATIPLCDLYEVIFENPKNLNDTRLLWYRFDEMKVFWKTLEKTESTKEEWEPAFSIADVSSMNVLSIENRKLLICLVNKPAIILTFADIAKLKCFVSLISGYYRLSVHWNLDLSSEFFSPMLSKMKKINCFGPIQDDHAKEILIKYRDENLKNLNMGLFLLKQCETEFKKLQICFEKDDSMRYFQIEWNYSLENPTFRWKKNEEEMDYVQFLDKLRQTKNLFQAILCNENDHLPDLLLCRKDEENENGENKETESQFLHSIPNDQIKKSILTMLNNGVFCTKIGFVKLNQNKEERVFVKEFIEAKEENLKIILKQFSDWSRLKNVAILNCKGIVPHPLSILFEHCHYTLREYFSQDFQINDCNLTEAVYFLAKAIDYLFSKHLNHGYIKFDNLYVYYFSKSSLFIKLGDPIGFSCDFNPTLQLPWLPPEYFEENSFFYRKTTIHSDVWAFATTVWEIFNNGHTPEFNYNTIDSVKLSETTMPNSIQSLVKRCWDKSLYTRIQPSTICREMIHILSNFYDNRKYQQQYVGHNNNFNFEKIYVDNKGYCDNNITNGGSPITMENGYHQRDFFDLVPSPVHLGDAFMISDHDDLLQFPAMTDVDYFPSENIRVIETIGQGHYGKVFRIEHEDSFYALKTVKTESNTTCNLVDEILILAKLRHKNIVKVVAFTRDISIDGTFYNEALIMEYLPLGSLREILRTKSKNDKLELSKLATDIASGLDFLSSKSIIHRDLATRNILVASGNSVKITDFGLAHILENNNQYYRYKMNRDLPIKWHAPESFENHVFSFKSDIWSYGIVLWEMYTYGSEPYSHIGETDKELLDYLKAGNRLDQPENCPNSVYALMRECWHYEPAKRPTAKEIYTKIKAIDEQIRDSFIYNNN